MSRSERTEAGDNCHSHTHSLTHSHSFVILSFVFVSLSFSPQFISLLGFDSTQLQGTLQSELCNEPLCCTISSTVLHVVYCCDVRLYVDCMSMLCHSCQSSVSDHFRFSVIPCPFVLNFLSCYVMLCHFMSMYVIVMSFYVILYHFCVQIICRFVSFYVVSCHLMSEHHTL